MFKKISKLLVENIETLFQRHNMEETFSQSHDMTENVDSYLKCWKIN